MSATHELVLDPSPQTEPPSGFEAQPTTRHIRGTGRLSRGAGTGALPGQLVVPPVGPHPAEVGPRAAWKRALDVCLAAVGLIALLPFLAAVALLIRLDSPGPALFRQRRVGLEGREFTMLKFRSMRMDAELPGEALWAQNEMTFPLFKMARDPRLTRIGGFLRRSSIDELPQLWNVIRGDMSLVGPRPPLTTEVVHFTPYQHGKFRVRPGITGLWQVKGRNDLASLDEMIELDLAYIRTWRPSLDLRILARTISVVLRRVGAR